MHAAPVRCAHTTSCSSLHELQHIMHDRACRTPPPADSAEGEGSSAAGAGSDPADAAAEGGREPPRRKPLTRHPDFPDLPSSVPLTYTLAIKACLSREPGERPTFPQLMTIIDDLKDEVSRGHYINGNGRAQVRRLHAQQCQPWCLCVILRGFPGMCKQLSWGHRIPGIGSTQVA